jgi:hypothetical protein
MSRDRLLGDERASALLRMQQALLTQDIDAWRMVARATSNSRSSSTNVEIF